jgi:hypothetical protein
MAISDAEWESIRQLIDRKGSSRAEEFYTGKVVKVDSTNRNVYLTQFGQQPIPIVAQDFQITYYDSVWNESLKRNVSQKKTAKATVIMPKKGDIVLVAREMGTARLPRCLGKVLGAKWVIAGGD